MAKIMLVDDAAFMRMMIKKALTQSGYSDFVEAQDGAEAVKKYGEEKLKESDASAKIVMCTAMGQESMVVDAIKSGAKDFIVKPFNAERIVQTVNSILGK